jgi:hypothetical protein
MPLRREAGGEVMKRHILLLLALIVLGAIAVAEEKTPITVNKSAVNNGVVIVNALNGKDNIELQCNKEQTSCQLPPPGQYLMARLPKNWGVYDCQCVDLYRYNSDPSADTEKLGEYCLMEK